ncbi:sulfite exporter TauE/SafE family protein [Candidatus Saccharibacteria bacterium]|nr:sulfite exporter TauE/SafE family protein [Candidatus Saccharibacteria bacterium]
MVPLLLPSFFAGILTFLAPCTLPLVPAYLGFISGVPPDSTATAQAKLVRRKVFKNGLGFVIGFSLVFIVLGTIAGLAGTALAPYRIWLGRVAGVFVILFGLLMLDILKIPLFGRSTGLPMPKILQRGNPLSSVLLGSAFGIGWTPCVGPVLGSILLLTTSTSTALQGAVMLGVFSLGLAIPFLLVAASVGPAMEKIQKITRYLRVASIIGGVFLILIGILLLSGKMALLISWGYQLLNFINYDQLTNYL